MLTATAFDNHASWQILLGSPLVGFLERLPAVRAATRPRLTCSGCRGVSPSALIRSLLAIGGRELDFKLMDFIPLSISSLALRYRQKLLQASAGGHRLWRMHSSIIPSLGRCRPAGREGSGRPPPVALSSSFAAADPWDRFAMRTRAVDSPSDGERTDVTRLANMFDDGPDIVIKPDFSRPGRVRGFSNS